MSRLDLTSLGSPQNTTVTAVLRTPTGSTTLKTFPVTDGKATIAFTAPATVPAGSTYVFTAQPSGTTVTIPAVASATGPVATSTTVTANSTRPIVRWTKPVLTVRVAGAGGPVTGGVVQITEGPVILGAANVVNGVATVRLPVFRATGARVLVARYSGTATAKPSQATVRLTVVRATASMSVTLKPRPVKKHRAATVRVQVRAVNGPVTGYVAIRERGRVIGLARVVNGKATVKLPRYHRRGGHKVRVSFLGNEFVSPKSQLVRFRVR